MQIRDLARTTGIPAKTIRYYETIGLLPRPPRSANNYRQYNDSTVDRLRFVAGARTLGFSLADIAEFLQARENSSLPCHRVMQSLDSQIAEIDHRIDDLVQVRATLERIREQSKTLPQSVGDETCVCDLFIPPQSSRRPKVTRANSVPKSRGKK